MKTLLYPYQLLLLLFIWSHGATTAQEPAMWHLADEDGLPSMTVYTIVQDQQGFLWFGTENGLCRYDGHSFKKYTNPKAKGNIIISLKKTETKQVFYLNLEGQLFYIQNDSSILFEDDQLLKDQKVYFQYVEHNNLWLFVKDANKKGQLLRYNIDEHGKIISSQHYPAMRPVSMITNDSSMLLVSKATALHQYQIYRYHPQTQKFDLVGDPAKFCFDSPHGLSPEGLRQSNGDFFLSSDYTIYKFDRHYQLIDSLQFPKNDQIQRIYTFREKIWAMTENTLLEVASHNLQQAPQKLLDSNYAINFLYEDAEKNIWVGTHAQGVYVIPNIEILHFNSLNSNLPDDRVFVIEPAQQAGNFFLGHGRGKVSFLQGQDLIKSVQLNSTEQTRIILRAPFTSGSYPFNPQVHHEFIENPFAPQEKIFCSTYIKAIEFDDQDNCWLGNYDATYLFDSSSPKHQKPLSKRTYALCYDFEQNMWIGTTQGIHKYHKGEVQVFQEAGQTNFYSVNAIVQSSDSTIWVATQADGLLAIKNDRIIQRFTKETAWKTNTCKNLFLDQQQQLWVGTDQGIYVVQLDNFSYKLLDKNDGLPSNEINAIYANDQAIWIGSPKGLSLLPRQLLHQVNAVHPPIHISKLRVWEKEVPLQKQYYFSHQDNNLSIDFLGFAYRNREPLEYRYRLLPLDSNWISTTSQFARFPSLPPNEYQFQVIAVNADQVASAAPAQLYFTIQKAWWQTWTFRIGLFLGGILLIAGLLYRRQQGILAKEKEKIAFAGQLNRLKIQALQAQMNPHFVFNALSAIQKYLTTNEQEAAMLYLAKFARLIRLIFEYSKEQLISLEEEINFLNLYLALEKLRFGKKIAIDFTISPSLNQQQDAIKIPPLLIQPIIENAFKHGLLHQAKTGTLKVKFEYLDNNYLRCSIEDNGIGRKHAKSLNSWKPKEYQSSGLSTTTARLKIINEWSGNKQEINHIEIIDLQDEAGHPIGTRVVLHIAALQANSAI